MLHLMQRRCAWPEWLMCLVLAATKKTPWPSQSATGFTSRRIAVLLRSPIIFARPMSQLPFLARTEYQFCAAQSTPYLSEQTQNYRNYG
jgi:hypothetical protein